jgi:hypothetical protein
MELLLPDMPFGMGGRRAHAAAHSITSEYESCGRCAGPQRRMIIAARRSFAAFSANHQSSDTPRLLLHLVGH